MGECILCVDNQIALYASVREDAIDPASCPIAGHERYEGFAGEVRRFDIGEVRESVPRRQYTRANRTQEGAGGHSRYLVRARRKANIELLVRNQLPDGGRTMRVEMDRNARMSFLERADHMRQETDRKSTRLNSSH